MVRRERGHAAGLLVFVLLCSLSATSEAQVRRLAELNVIDLRALDRAKTVVIVPAGLFEEHGPFLPSFTGGYVNEWLTTELGEAIEARPGWHVVVLPTIPLGVGSPEDFAGRQPFSGSYTVRPATLRAVFMDLADALGADGFRWIFILHRHGSPAHNRALLEAGDYFRDNYHGMMIPLTSYVYTAVQNRPPVWSDDEGRENAGDVHGGADETSRMLFVRPDLVRPGYRSATPQPAATDADLPAVAAAAEWPGYFGSPRLGRPDAGGMIMRRLADDLTQLAERVLEGFDPSALPNRGNSPGDAFKTLDQNLLRRSSGRELRQLEWLRSKGLQ